MERCVWSYSEVVGEAAMACNANSSTYDTKCTCTYIRRCPTLTRSSESGKECTPLYSPTTIYFPGTHVWRYVSWLRHELGGCLLQAQRVCRPALSRAPYHHEKNLLQKRVVYYCIYNILLYAYSGMYLSNLRMDSAPCFCRVYIYICTINRQKRFGISYRKYV